MAAVDRTIADLNLAEIPRIIALNKADLLEPEAAQRLADEVGGMLISGVKRNGLREIKTAIVTLIRENLQKVEDAKGAELPGLDEEYVP
jgi:50S ribosomal subunit-associated GTPase HflX